MSAHILATFDTPEAAQAAVRRLLDAGLERDRVSVALAQTDGTITTGAVTNEGTLLEEGAARGFSTGAVVGGAIGVLAGIGLGFVPVLGFVVAGPLAGLLAGAASGAATGGIVGGLVGLGIPEAEAGVYEDRLRAGATLVAADVAELDADRYEALLHGAGATEVTEDGRPVGTPDVGLL